MIHNRTFYISILPIWDLDTDFGTVLVGIWTTLKLMKYGAHDLIQDDMNQAHEIIYAKYQTK